MNLNHVTLPAVDVRRSAAFYRALGLLQIVDASHYARFEFPDGEATLSVHLSDALDRPGVVVYFECAQLDDRVRQLQSHGFVFTALPSNQPWLWREARLKDPSGNVICLFAAGDNRRNPPYSARKRHAIETARV